jgi:hypothetical protein
VFAGADGADSPLVVQGIGQGDEDGVNFGIVKDVYDVVLRSALTSLTLNSTS